MKKNIVVVIVIFILAAILFAVSSFFWGGEKGNKLSVSLGKFYGIKKDRAKLFIDHEEKEEKGLVFEERAYVHWDFAKSILSRLFYEEENETVIYTDALNQEIYKIDEKNYLLSGEEKEMEYSPFVFKNETIFVALDFIKERYELDYILTEAPHRLLIYLSDKTYEKTIVTQRTQIRTEADIDSVYLEELEDGDEVWKIDSESFKDFDKILTKDGILGFVKKKYLSPYEKEARRFKREDLNANYKSIHYDFPVILGWHQVFSEKSNSGLQGLLNRAAEVNVISPTWFSIIREDGELSSFASKAYVDLAHQRGVKVWALVNDFDKKVDYYELFMKEKNRRSLINNLVYFINEYQLDGINIDFETIKAEYAEGYVQFLREFSIVMRKLEKVLSVDNYVPASHTDFYNRREQGIVADYICVMAYDEHYFGSSEPGSVSSVSWVRRGISMMGEEVDKKKLIIGLPFYTRIWKRTAEGNLETRALSMEEGFQRVREAGANSDWDEETGQYYAEWKKESDLYQIWLEDEKSIQTKLQEIKKSEVSGLAFWKLGLEQTNVWKAVKEWNNE